MATHKSAEKRARQSIRRTKVNTKTIGSVRTTEKKIRTALANNDAKSAKELLREFSRNIQKATSKGRVHGNTASRKISRLASRIHHLTVHGSTTKGQQAQKKA